MISVQYLTAHWQPITGLIVGVLIEALYFYLYFTKDKRIVPWIAKFIFRNQFMSEKSADSLFKVVTSYLFMFGGLWIVLAIYFLTNS